VQDKVQGQAITFDHEMEELLQVKEVLVTWMKVVLHGDSTVGCMNTVLLAGEHTAPVIKMADGDIDSQACNSCFVKELN
jgi:hypothetical protein